MNASPTTAAQRDRWRRYGAFAAGVAERVRHGASYNPLSERTVQNPYPVYARLREHSPVHRSVTLGSWIISGYDDVLAVARDHERFSNDPRWRNATASVLPPAPDDYSILLVDPPEHTRLRKVAARAFTRPKLMELTPAIETLANDIVDRAVKRAEVEWMAEVAQPMAMRVMLRMLGIAGDEETRWHQWSTDRARLLDMIATRAERKTAHITGESMTGYFRERLAERARADADEAISLLAREAARGEFINTAEAADSRITGPPLSIACDPSSQLPLLAAAIRELGGTRCEVAEGNAPEHSIGLTMSFAGTARRGGRPIQLVDRSNFPGDLPCRRAAGIGLRVEPIGPGPHQRHPRNSRGTLDVGRRIGREDDRGSHDPRQQCEVRGI